ncbi:MAG: Ig-like domain-containing protein, partial [Candidatus Levyibacteriota bacterium]
MKNLFQIFKKNPPSAEAPAAPAPQEPSVSHVSLFNRKIKAEKFVIIALVLIVLLAAARYFLPLIFLAPQVSLKYVIAFLVLFIVITLIYLRRPDFFLKPINKIREKIPILHSHAKRHYDTANLHTANWLERFSESTPKEQWAMVRIPLGIILLLFLVWKFGYLFLPPQVAVSFPGDKSVEVPLDARIEVVFDKGVIKGTVEKSFSISPAVAGSVSWEGNQKFIFIPKKPLSRAASYQISFRGLVLSNFLSPLLGLKTITFSTLGDPKVIIASPQSEALEGMVPITVVFDRQMVPLTTATNSAEQKSPISMIPEINGEGRWLGTTAYQFRPSEQ